MNNIAVTKPPRSIPPVLWWFLGVFAAGVAVMVATGLILHFGSDIARDTRITIRSIYVIGMMAVASGAFLSAGYVVWRWWENRD